MKDRFAFGGSPPESPLESVAVPRAVLAASLGGHQANTRSSSGFQGCASGAIAGAAMTFELPQQRRPFTPDLDEATLAVHLEAKVNRLLLGLR